MGSLPYWLTAIGIFAAVAWAWYPESTPPPPPTELTTEATELAAAAVPAPSAPLRAPASDGPSAPAVRAPSHRPPATPPASRLDDDAPARATRRSRRLRRRAVPPGTSDDRADAFRKLPHGRGDGAPLKGVGGEGVHVDQLSLGARYRDGECAGASQGFSVSRHDKIHACIRVVHRRVGQRVAVRWERDGHLVRRQWLPIPSVHAFRTRASLPVRSRFRGKWRVRVLSDDGVELATAAFTISD